MACCALPAGWAADRFGRRALLLIGSFTIAIALFARAFSLLPATLHAAGTEKADILVLSASSVGLGREVIREARALNPRIRVVARTSYLKEADELIAAGATAGFSGEGEVALSMTESILGTCGATPEQIERESERIRRELLPRAG